MAPEGADEKKPRWHRWGAGFGEGGEWTSVNGEPGQKPDWVDLPCLRRKRLAG